MKLVDRVYWTGWTRQAWTQPLGFGAQNSDVAAFGHGEGESWPLSFPRGHSGSLAARDYACTMPGNAGVKFVYKAVEALSTWNKSYCHCY